MNRMIQVFSLVIGMMTCHLLTAQTYHNEWINYDQAYCKIKVAKNGLYRIPYSELETLGFPMIGSGFQLYSRGEQVALFTSADGVMTSDDYLLFYGTVNDGSFDTQLYANPDWQAHQLKSLFSDTIGYFLTWNNDALNARYSLTPNDIAAPPPPDDYFLQEVKRLFNNIFHAGRPIHLGYSVSFPLFEEGETFTGQHISSSFSFSLPTPHQYIGDDVPFPFFEITLIEQVYTYLSNDSQSYQINIGDTPYFYDTHDDYSLIRTSSFVLPTNIGDSITPIQVVKELASSSSNYLSVTNASITYPRLFDFENLPIFEFSLQDHNARYLEITNFNGGIHPLLFDRSNQLVLEPVLENGMYKIMLPETTGMSGLRNLVLVNTDSYCLYPCQMPVCSYTGCNTFDVNNLTSFYFTDYAQVNNQGNYLIITHPDLRKGSTDWVQQYADYRSSAGGGGYTAQIANIKELYDQFAWGIPKNPLAIRHFVNYALDNWTIQPEYSFLIGKGISYESIRYNPLGFNKCLVPTFGHQPADILLVARNAQEWLPQLPIGRLSAQTADDVRKFYEKINQYESPKPCTWDDRAWTKKAIFAAGAHYNSDRDSMLSILQKHAAILDSSTFNLFPVETYGQASFIITPQEQFNESFNNGALLFDYIGEGISGFNINFDLQPPSAYENINRNPFIIANSSFVGDNFNFGSSNIALTEKFVLIEDIGAIGGLASTGIENYSYANPIYKLLLRNLFHHFTDQPFGYSLHQVFAEKLIPEAITHNDLATNLALLTLHYEGDPALQLAGRYTVPEFTLLNPEEQPDLNVINPQTGIPYTSIPITLDNDTLLMQFGIGNLGAEYAGQIPLLIQQTNSLGNIVKTDTFYVNTTDVFNEINLTVPVFYTEVPDTFVITVSLNFDMGIVEDCYDNNSVSFTVITTGCNQEIQPVVTNLLPSYCSSDAPVLMHAEPEGGIFYVNGVEQTQLNPADYEGTVEVKYEIDSPTVEGCLESTEFAVEFIQTPTAQLTISDTIVCVGESIFVSALLYPSANYSFNFASGNITAIGNQSYGVEWNTPGTKVISLVTSIGNCVSEPFQQTIVVYAPPQTPIITCGVATANSITINWNAEPSSVYYQVVLNGIPQSVTTPTFTVDDLEPNSSALFQVTAFNNNPVCNMSNPSLLLECFTDNCLSIPLSIEGLPQNICTNTEPFEITGIPTGGYFTLNDESFNGYLEPETMEATNYSLSYHFEIAGCEYEETVLFDIHQSPNPQISITGTLCEGDNNQLVCLGPFYAYLWNNGQQTQTISINESGLYSLTVTGDYNCSASISEVVELFPQPQLTLPDSLQIDIGQFPYLLQTGFEQTDAQYIWNTGDTNSAIYITEAGAYSVTVTDVNGCASEASVLVDVTVGTTPHAGQGIHIYPNPVTETLFIEGVIQQNVTVNLYNSIGQLVKQQPLSAMTTNTIETHSLTPGVYYLQIELPDKVMVQKVVKW